MKLKQVVNKPYQAEKSISEYVLFIYKKTIRIWSISSEKKSKKIRRKLQKTYKQCAIKSITTSDKKNTFSAWFKILFVFLKIRLIKYEQPSYITKKIKIKIRQEFKTHLITIAEGTARLLITYSVFRRWTFVTRDNDWRCCSTKWARSTGSTRKLALLLSWTNLIVEKLGKRRANATWERKLWTKRTSNVRIFNTIEIVEWLHTF